MAYISQPIHKNNLIENSTKDVNRPLSYNLCHLIYREDYKMLSFNMCLKEKV